MIYDRTESDVENSKIIRETKIQKGLSLTEEETAVMERGTLTISTLNRIEKKQEDLSNKFEDMAYFGEKIDTKSWDSSNIFFKNDYERILLNLRKLIRIFFIYSTTPNIPTVSFHYQSVNDLEKILYDLEEMVKDVENNYRECGIYRCGEVV